MKEKVVKAVVIVGFVVALVIAGIVEFARFNMIKDFYTDDSHTEQVLNVAEQGATVIVEYPDGNVYTFYGEDYEIADNRITVFFED